MAFVERDWISTATVACDTALNMLAFAHKLAKKDKILNAKVCPLQRCIIFTFPLILLTPVHLPSWLLLLFDVG